MPSPATASRSRCASISRSATWKAPTRGSPPCSTRRCGGCSAKSTLTQVVRDQREQLMSRVREQLDTRGAGLRHRHRRRAHSPRRSAGAEQPGGLPAHDHRAPARGAGIPLAGHPAGAGDSRQGRSRRHRACSPMPSRRASRSAARAMASATASSPRPSDEIRSSSRSIGRCRPTKPACAPTTPACCSSPIRTSSASSWIHRARRARSGASGAIAADSASALRVPRPK